MFHQINPSSHSKHKEESKVPPLYMGKRARQKSNDLARLCSIIEEKCKNGSTTVTNCQLASEMNCGASKVARLLKVLSKSDSATAWAIRFHEGGFLFVRRTELTKKNGEYRCRRVMNMFSPLSDEDGALLVTDMIADAGKHYRTEVVTVQIAFAGTRDQVFAVLMMRAASSKPNPNLELNIRPAAFRFHPLFSMSGAKSDVFFQYSG